MDATNKKLALDSFFVHLKPVVMYFFYVLYSLKDNRLYKGYSSNLGNRFIKHNFRGTRSTQNRVPLVLIHAEKFSSKKDALSREQWAKSLKGSQELIHMLKEKNILNENLEIHLCYDG